MLERLEVFFYFFLTGVFEKMCSMVHSSNMQAKAKIMTHKLEFYTSCKFNLILHFWNIKWKMIVVFVCRIVPKMRRIIVCRARMCVCVCDTRRSEEV